MKSALMVSLLLLTIDAAAPVQAKSYVFTAAIFPGQVEVNQLASYLVNITNIGDSPLGSISLAIPEGFTVLHPVTIINRSSTWNYTLSATAIDLTAISGGYVISMGESVLFAFDVVAPGFPSVATWTVEATSSISGGGVKFTLKGEQPRVNVILPLIAPTISASPDVINQCQFSLLSQVTEASGGTPPYNYQWFEAYNGGTFSPIMGANGPNYTFSTTNLADTGTWSFRLKVTDSSSFPVSATSNTVNVTVNPKLAAPEVNATPNVVLQNETAFLTSAAVTTGTPPYSYQWFQKAPGGEFITVGRNFVNYTFPGATITGSWMFLLQVTDNTGESVNSTAVEVNVVSTPVFTITVIQAAHGTINPGTTSVTLGGNQSFTITADEGYYIVDVLVDGASIGSVASYTFLGVDADHNLTAIFNPFEYTLRVEVIGSGNVVKSPEQATYRFGDIVQLTAVPASGWSFSFWTGDLTGSSNPSLLTIDGNKNVTATFLINQYMINATAGLGGSISPSGVTFVDYGGIQTYIITPDEGYYIVDVLVNGTSVGPVSSYTVSNVTGDTTITASFAPVILTIEASAGPNGSISPYGNVIVAYGGNQSFIIRAEEGYYVVDVLVDGVSVGTVASYTFIEVVTNHSIVANFAKNVNYYFISVISPYGAPTSSAWVNAGDNFTVSVTSLEGGEKHRWVCVGYSVDGGEIVSGTSYTFSSVQANHTIMFTWQEQCYLTVVSPEGSISGQGWYERGSAATVSVARNTVAKEQGVREVFAGWAEDFADKEAASKLIIMDEPKTLTALWKTQCLVTYAASGNVLDVAVPPSEWVDRGTQATGVFPAMRNNPAGNIRVILVGDDRPFAVTEPVTVTGVYKTQYLVTFTQNGLASEVSGVVVTVLGEAVTCERLPYSVWVDAGSPITFSYASAMEDADGQYILANTSLSSPFIINEPVTVEGFYELQINPSGFYPSETVVATLLVAVPASMTLPLIVRGRKWRKIKPFASEGGIISPSMMQKVKYGGDSTVFIVAANPGYKIVDVIIDGEVHLGPVRTYKFINVTKNHTISAVFQKK